MGEDFVCTSCELDFNTEDVRKYVCSDCFNVYCGECADDNDNICPTCAGILVPDDDEE